MHPTPKHSRFLNALSGQTVDSTPVWIMRQAGRYLPEYRQLRKQAKNFMEFCQAPELACEATLQPLRRFDLDASILFSDILTIPDALGCKVQFLEGEGPHLEPIKGMKDVLNLPKLNTHENLSYVLEAIKLIKGNLPGNLPLIGFSGSPWTLATYMVEGKGSKDFSKIKAMTYEAPDIIEALLENLTEAVANYLNAQIEAGVDVVMLFDTWGGILPPKLYRHYSLSAMQKVIQKIQNKAQVPVILFSKGCAHSLNHMKLSGASCLGVDWMTEMAEARRVVGADMCLQGNLDPMALLASEKELRALVREVIDQNALPSRHIFNLGHGIMPEANPEHLAILIDEVHQYSKQKLSR